MSLRDSIEFIRLRLGITTPLEAGVEGALPGDEPPWQTNPSNQKIQSAITAACKVANQHFNLAGSGAIRSVPVLAVSTNGPLQIDLSAMTGFGPRKLNSIRRIWWNGTRIWPTTLAHEDVVGSTYIIDSPSTPLYYAIEDYNLYLLPAPSTDGIIQFMAGAGVLAPTSLDDNYDQIPEDYDTCLDYMALVELGKMMPEDQGMTARAMGFTDNARDGLERLGQWHNGGSNDQSQGRLIFDATYMRRFRIRR